MKEPKTLGLLERKRYERSKRRKKKRIITGVVLGVIAVVAVACFVFKPWERLLPTGPSVPAVNLPNEGDKNQKDEQVKQTIAQAERLALSYAYDEAIELLQTIDGYEKKKDVTDKIAAIEAEKATCVPVKLEEVTHIFYHTLVVDPERAFANQDTDPQAVGNNQWMTTIDEFNAINEEMYKRGYVMVSIHDLYEETKDANGNTVWQPATILLPEGKKAFVLSLDDLSYYHSYDGYGYASKLILDENGKVTNEYIDANGNVLIGAYDAVPLMDQFVEEHPDFSYKGAKGIIALTGYNGILGYRTDITYDLSNPDCDFEQKAWINAHPNFNLETERAEAKKVADAMKANGWEFASHTWGHAKVGDRSLASLKIDTQKWRDNVEPIVGATDTIIFAHGQDLEDAGPYSSSNEKYQYFREQGYRIFCNVDSNRYVTYLGTDYLRQGRRNIDGYRIYRNSVGIENNLSDLFDAKEIIDPKRPPVPSL